MTFFLGGNFEFFLLQFNEKTKGFHMRYHLYLHYGWFLQNLGKDFIQTNMHTTVCIPTHVLVILLPSLLSFTNVEFSKMILKNRKLVLILMDHIISLDFFI